MNRIVQGSIVWFITTLFVVYAFCLNTAAAVFAEPIKIALQATSLEATLATSSFILGFACMQIPAGFMLDRFNARFVVSGGILVLALGNSLTSYSSHLLIFSLSNFLQGVGASFAFIAVAVLIAQWFSSKLFPILFGLTQTLACIAAGLIHYFLTLALKTHGWDEIYRALALCGFVLFILALILVKNPSRQKRNAHFSFRKSLSLVVKNKQIWLCTVAGACSFGVLLAYVSYWYAPVQKFYLLTDSNAEIVSGMIFLGMGVGTPLLGWISNLLKSRMMVIHVSLALGTMALLLGLYLPHYKSESMVIINGISFMIGFLLSGSMLFYTVVSELSTDATRGVAISLLNTAVFLTNTLLLFIPYLFIFMGSIEFFTYLWVLPFFLMLSMVFIYFIKEN